MTNSSISLGLEEVNLVKNYLTSIMASVNFIEATLKDGVESTHPIRENFGVNASIEPITSMKNLLQGIIDSVKENTLPQKRKQEINPFNESQEILKPPPRRYSFHEKRDIKDNSFDEKFPTSRPPPKRYSFHAKRDSTNNSIKRAGDAIETIEVSKKHKLI